MAQADRIGTTIAGYRIERVVGRGGMGVVYEAEQLALGRKVALKVLAPELAEDPRFRERFLRESRVAASLDDPNILPIHEAGESDGTLFIAMRYVQGTDLGALIEQEGPLPPERVVSIVSQVASALDTAHDRGLVHRDVKPANVLLVPSPQSSRPDKVYLADFGLTKRAASDSGVTGTGQFVGTLDYAAPEQFTGEALTPATDTYSLGCVLYECLVGEAPFPRDREAALLHAHLNEPPPRVTEKRPDLPTGIDAVVAKAMAKRPGDRFDSAGELAGAAREALGPAGPAGGPPPSARRFVSRWLLVGGAVVVVAAAVALLLLVPRHPGKHGHRATPPVAPSTSATSPAVPSNSVVEIDPATKKVTETVPGVAHPLRIAVGEGGVWVLSGFANLIHVDPGSRSTTAIPIRGSLEGGVAVGNGAVWVASGGIERVDPATDQVADVISGAKAVPALDSTGVAVGSGAVWVTSADGTLVRIDPGTDHIEAAIKVGSDAEDVAVGAGSVWVADALDSVVYRIDPRTDRKVATIKVGGADQVGVGSGAVWVLDHATGTVSRVDPTTNRVVTTIRVGNDPTRITAGLGAIWISDGADGSIYRIAPVTDAVTSISVGGPVESVAIDETDRTLWAIVGS